jgi:hypothetical protein
MRKHQTARRGRLTWTGWHRTAPDNTRQRDRPRTSKPVSRRESAGGFDSRLPAVLASPRPGFAKARGLHRTEEPVQVPSTRAAPRNIVRPCGRSLLLRTPNRMILEAGALLAGEYDVGLPPRNAAEYAGLFEHARVGGEVTHGFVIRRAAAAFGPAASVPSRYAAVGAPNQVVSASASPRCVRSPTQATYPSGRINAAAGAVTAPSTGSSHVPTYLASIS